MPEVNDSDELPYGYKEIGEYATRLHEDGLLQDESRIKDLMGFVDNIIGYHQNKGLKVNRLDHNPREKAFHDQWLKENEPKSWINQGHGVLQDLFIESDINMFNRKIHLAINDRDRYIVATVVQWLGSNCGMCFLGEALARVGMKIVETKKTD